MSLRINNNNELIYRHDCEGCQVYGFPEDDEECLMCGYTGSEIKKEYERVEKFNFAYKQVYRM